jgi:hypothetical protein
MSKPTWVFSRVLSLLILQTFLSSVAFSEPSDGSPEPQSELSVPVTCEAAVDRSPSTRYLEARETLEDAYATGPEIDEAFSDFHFLSKLGPVKGFSFGDDFTTFLAESFLLLPANARPRAAAILLKARRPADLQTLEQAELLCRSSSDPKCHLVKLTSLRALIAQWRGPAASPMPTKSSAADSEKAPAGANPIGEGSSNATGDFETDDEVAPDTTWTPPSAEESAPWSAADENTWEKTLARERSDVRDHIKEELIPLLANGFRSKDLNSDEEIISLLKTVLFPTNESWRADSIEIPEDTFNVVRGNQNPWESPLLRTLSLAAMIMQRYQYVLKRPLSEIVKSHDLPKDHNLAESILVRERYFVGFHWLWRTPTNNQADEATQEAWNILQPLIRYTELCEFLLRYSSFGFKSKEEVQVDRVQKELVKRFIQANLKSTGIVEVLLLRSQTSDRLKPVLRDLK